MDTDGSINIGGLEFTELFGEEELDRIVGKCADSVKNALGDSRDLTVIGVLNGGVPLCNQIAFSLPGSIRLDYVKAVSYGSSLTSSGEVKLLMDISEDITGRDVLIVDDIIDSGRTAYFLKRHMEKKGAGKVYVCSLFYKRNDRVPAPDFFGAEINEEFIVGYGLDYAGLGRNLKRILKLKK